MRLAIKWVYQSMLAAMVAVGLLLSGFLLQRFEVQPFHKIANRIENKLNEMQGVPNPLDQQVAQIETTSLRLQGTVYRMKDNDFISGGGLAQWGQDLLLVQRTGKMMRLDSQNGLVAIDIAAPENGTAAYTALADDPNYSAYSINKPHRIRYNDILFVDTPEQHGLALSYTFFDSKRGCYGTRVDWLAVPRDASAADFTATAADWRRLFETNPCLPLNTAREAIDGIMAGGRMAFQAPATLVLGSGEYHLDGVHAPDAGIQDDASDYGKVIGINLNSGDARHISKGHRNMQGVAVDRQGRIWVTEHGVRGGDELNLIREGTNYGWPLETLGTLYSGQPFPTEGEEGRHILHEPPVYAWLPSAAVSGLAVIDGFHPTWDGDLLATSLSSSEFGHSLFRIRIRDKRVIFVERIRLGFRIRYVMQFGDQIAVWSDKNDLILFTHVPRRDPLLDALALLTAEHPDALANEVEQILRSCNECHSYEQGNHGGAPSLNGVVGRSIGSVGFNGYSEVLARMGGKWTPERLAAYLAEPQDAAPGTSMPDPGLEQGEVLDTLIWTLERLDSTHDEHLKYN